MYKGKQVRKQMLAPSDTVEAAFKKFDTDGSGKLEKGELLNVLGELGLDVTDADFVAYAKALMEDYDADGNGELDFDEFKKLHAQCLASEETRAAYAKELKEAVGGLVTGALTSIIENDAAAKIQAMYKGKQARQDVERLKEEISAAEKEAADAAEFTGTDDEQAAATKLQAMQRGRKARAKVAELKAKQAAAEAERVAAAAEAETMEAEKAAAEFVGTPEEQAAATKVQAIQRGRVARAKLAAEKAAADAKLAELDAAIAAANVEEVNFEVTEEEQTAATKLQSIQRGRKARAEVDRLRREREAAAAELAELNAAALKIQAVHRGKMTRMELREKREQEAAALKIQAVHRGKMTRMELREKREQEAAALKIQAVHRGKMTRMELRDERLRQEREGRALVSPSAPAPPKVSRNKVAPSAPIVEEDFSEDEDYSTRAKHRAAEAASNLVHTNPNLADALEAASWARRPAPSPRRGSGATETPRTKGGLSRHVVADLAQRLPALCGGGRGGEMEALKLIAAVVATRKRPVRRNKVVPL